MLGVCVAPAVLVRGLRLHWALWRAAHVQGVEALAGSIDQVLQSGVCHEGAAWRPTQPGTAVVLWGPVLVYWPIA